MRRFMKGRRGEKGFTLIELLIVVAILGILAAVIIPNVTAFITTGNLNAANTEVENVKTASLAYYADNSTWPATSDDLIGGTTPYVSGVLKAKYTFWTDTGFLYTASGSLWSAKIIWQDGTANSHGKWIKKP